MPSKVGASPPTLEVVKKTGEISLKSFSSSMRFISTEPTMPRQPTKPTESPGLKFIISSLPRVPHIAWNSVITPSQYGKDQVKCEIGVMSCDVRRCEGNECTPDKRDYTLPFAQANVIVRNFRARYIRGGLGFEMSSTWDFSRPKHPAGSRARFFPRRFHPGCAIAPVRPQPQILLPQVRGRRYHP